MPATSQQDKVQVDCPQCGHSQLEPRIAYSTNCKKCGGHIRVQDVLKPAKKKAAYKSPEADQAKKRIKCFDCGADLDVVASAQSTMCKKCSRYMDLKDYHIANAVSKNFKTKGAFVI